MNMAHQMIVSAIVDAIALPDYKPPMPHLDKETWDKILDWKKNERRNNFFEWMGDSLLYAAISVELCRQVPQGAEGIFTQVRSGLASNKTFTHLTHKMGVLSNVHQWRRHHPSSKLFADFFEVVAAEVYRKFGFEVLCEWVRDVFSPLISAALIPFTHIPRQVLKVKTIRRLAFLNHLPPRAIRRGSVFKPKDHTPRPLAKKIKSLLRAGGPGLLAKSSVLQSQVVLPARVKTNSLSSSSSPSIRHEATAGASAFNPIVIDDDNDPVVVDEDTSEGKIPASHEVIVISDD